MVDDLSDYKSSLIDKLAKWSKIIGDDPKFILKLTAGVIEEEKLQAPINILKQSKFKHYIAYFYNLAITESENSIRDKHELTDEIVLPGCEEAYLPL